MITNTARGIVKPTKEAAYVYTSVDYAYTRDNNWSDWVIIPELIGAHGFCGCRINGRESQGTIYMIQYFDENNKWCISGKTYGQGDLQFNSELGAIRMKYNSSSGMTFNYTWHFYIW